MLIPRRKHLGKAVARRSKRAIAAESLNDPEMKKYVGKIIGEKVAKEVKTMARSTTQSVLKSQNIEHLKSFSWSTLLEELSKFTCVETNFGFSD